jgi:hypothetical protein
MTTWKRTRLSPPRPACGDDGRRPGAIGVPRPALLTNGRRGPEADAMPNRGHRAAKGTLDTARGSVRPTPPPLGAEVESWRARALITLVRPTPPPLGAEVESWRARAIGRHWMTKAGRTTPPSRTATLCGIRGTCKACNADSERSARNQTLQHRCSSNLSLLKGEVSSI